MLKSPQPSGSRHVDCALCLERFNDATINKATQHENCVRLQVNELDFWRENREHMEEMERIKETKRKERQRNAQIRKGTCDASFSVLSHTLHPPAHLVSQLR
ncbi:unnamed protein product [Ectocarpus sp. 4 AP-2014]